MAYLPSLVKQDALRYDDKLADTVRGLLSMDKGRAKSILGDTTVTAYRRVHEIVSSALDRAEIALQQTKDRSEILKLLIDFSRCSILVAYQRAREQISGELASTLTNIINFVIDELKKEVADREVIRRARTLIDALAVLVYQFGKK